jgi:hypothetical protein
MWSQPTPTSAGVRPGFARSLATRDWGLLVRLPPRVLAAVLAVPLDPPPVSAGIAGLAVIAQARSARRAAAALVREVAVAIFASEESPSGYGFPYDDVVRAECADAGHVLAQRVPTAEAERYRCWVLRIGEAALDGTPIPDDPIGASQARLLAECEQALAG